jgi:DNA-binding MarR family transcriptional regulator
MPNPADLSLTAVQFQVYTAIKKRHKSGQLTTRADIADALGGRDKSWLCRILRALSARGLVERYQQRYYKLAN